VTLKLRKLIIPLAAALAVLLLGFVGWRLTFHKNSSVSLARVRSIAVMPFEDLSPQKDQSYMCEGLADELITRLIGVEGLKIPARTSSFLLRGKGPQEVGQKLGVEAVLDGTLLKADQKIHVNLQIVDARSGYGLWSGKFDGDEKGLFSLRDEIALKILESLKISLMGEAKAKVVRNYTENSGAYNLYLQGRFFWNKRAPADVQKAIEYFNQAIALDSNFALAYSGLADSYLTLPQFAEYRMSEALPKAKDAALKAMAIDNTLAEAHVSLALVKETEWDFAAAENEFKRAIELNPNYATGHHWYANLLAMMGRLDESGAEMKRALELDPLSLIINVVQAFHYLEVKKFDQAIEQARKGVELDQNFVYSRYTLGVCFRVKGLFKEAVAELEKARELFGSSPSGLGDLGMD
jgi:TolB-like protein